MVGSREERKRHGKAGSWGGRPIVAHVHGQADRQTGKQTGKQTDKKTDTQALHR